MKADDIALQIRYKEQGELLRTVNALNTKKARFANIIL